MSALFSSAKLCAFLGLLTLFFAAACDQTQRGEALSGEADGPSLRLRDAEARRAGLAASGAFAFMRYEIRVDGDQPQACLIFSSSLDPDRDYSGFIGVEGANGVALSVEGADLCIGGLRFTDTPVVEIRAGLPALDGRALEFGERVNIQFGDQPAYVGFKGDGVILPRIDADGLAIESINVDIVGVKISRITDRALAFRTISAGFSAPQGGYGYMDYNSEVWDLAEPLWEGQVRPRAAANTLTTTVLPIAAAIPRLKPGAYFIELDQLTAGGKAPVSGARAKRWLIITDLALTTYTGQNGMSVSVRSIQSARPAGDVRVDLIARNNEILASGESDATGHVRFSEASLKGRENSAPRLLMAYAQNGDFAVLDLDRPPIDLTDRNIDGRSPSGQVDAYVWTERGVYRPGERVEITALLRDQSARALTDRPGTVSVFAPNGIEAGRYRFESAADAGAVTYSFQTPRSASRGQWRVVVEADGVGEAGAARFSVEDFVPQRVALKLSPGAQALLGPTAASLPLSANVRFLYGAPGAGLPVTAVSRVEVDPNPFPDFKGVRFGRHDETFYETAFDLAAATTDANGDADLVLDPAASGSAVSSQPLRFRTVVSVTEPGGRAVRDDVRTAWRPNSRYIGIEPAFDEASAEGKPAEFQIVSVSPQGQLTDGEVSFRLVRIDWKYDWFRTEFGEWQWRSSQRLVDVEEGLVRLTGGRGTIKTRALDWGDYELLVAETKTGAEASIAFWSGWGSQANEGGAAPDKVRISLPETLPAPGGEVEIGILPPYAGEAEIVIASDNVIATRTLPVRTEGTRVRIPVTADWNAGVYVMASVYTPRDAVDRPKPRRAVGVVHLPVNVAPRTHQLTLTAPKVQKPRSKMTIDIQSAGGPRQEETFVRIAAVDEGILQLTRYASPDPVAHYFGKKRLGVELRDDYGRLLDPNQGAAARFGGDQIGGAGLTVVPTRSVSLLSPPVRLNRNGRATVSLDVPEFSGELRLMAVAWSRTGLGWASEAITVRDDVSSELILPRFLAPGDEANATLSLDNVAGASGRYRISLTATGPLRFRTPETEADVQKGQRRDTVAPVRALSEGVASLRARTTGPDQKVVERSYNIQVRSPFMPTSAVERRMIRPGESWRATSDSLASLAPDSARIQVSFSTAPLDASALAASLARYPYGCTEQIVSRAMPLLMMAQNPSLSGGRAAGDVRREVQETVSALLNRQGPDGAIGLWRMGDGQSDPWLGAFAVDFLARAKSAGYVVPDAALDRAYDALEDIAVRENQWSTSYDFDVPTSRANPDTPDLLMSRSVAYGAYVLARAGRMDRSRLRYLHDQSMRTDPSPLSRAHIGAALFMIGDSARSKSAFDQAERALGYSNEGDFYQTPRRDLAGVLMLAAEAGQTARIERLSARVNEDLPEPDRLTTQEKAFLLMAYDALSGGRSSPAVQLTGQAQILTPSSSYEISRAQLATSPATFTNVGTAPIYLTAVTRGTPTSAPPPARQGMLISKALYRPDGARVSTSEFRQGDRLIVAIEIASQSARETPAIIADLLPAGFEIEAVLRPQDAAPQGPYRFLGELTQPEMAEARDDRFVAAVTLYDKKSATVAYMVRAVTPGRFTLPGVSAEDMYRPDVFARTGSRQITIAGSR
jgi:hypothetical protein